VTGFVLLKSPDSLQTSPTTWR